MRVENVGNELIATQRAVFLLGPPTAGEKQRCAFLGRAGGVFKFEHILFNESVEVGIGREKIVGEFAAKIGLGDERKPTQTDRRQISAGLCVGGSLVKRNAAKSGREDFAE